MNCGLKHLSDDDRSFLFWWQQKAERIITDEEFWEKVNKLKNKKIYTKLYRIIL